eukprot:4961322-Pyramimonas_sp.AAC.1
MQFGRIPKRNTGTPEQERAENELAKRFSDNRDRAPKDVLDELRALGCSDQQTDAEEFMRKQKTEEIMQRVRDLGRHPKENAGRSLAERQLAEKVRKARKAEQFSPEQGAELQAFKQAESEATTAIRIAEAEGLPNPME